MPAAQRRRPRPQPLDTPHINCEKDANGVHNAEDCKTCAWQRARNALREAARKRKEQEDALKELTRLTEEMGLYDEEFDRER